DLLNSEIGSALAMNSGNELSPQLVDIWRISSNAMSNVGQLPLGLLPFNKTEEFLSNISDFTYRTALRDLDDEPLDNEETEALENLYDQSSEIKNELRQVQHLALENNLRWMDVQVALTSQNEPQDNTIIDGLKTVEDKLDGFTETHANSHITGTPLQDHSYKNIKGEEVSEEKALEKSKQIFNISNEDD